MMQRALCVAGGLLVAVGLCGGVLNGCSSDQRAPLGASSSSGSTGSSGSAGIDGGSDAQPFSPLCANPAPLAGDPIPENIIRANTPPDPIGGPIGPGTYDLSDMNVFQDIPRSEDGGINQLTGVIARKTLVIGDGGTYQLAEAVGTEDAGLPSAATVTGAFFSAAGTSLRADIRCPKVTTATYGYSAVGDNLLLYTGPNRREAYSKRP